MQLCRAFPTHLWGRIARAQLRAGQPAARPACAREQPVRAAAGELGGTGASIILAEVGETGCPTTSAPQHRPSSGGRERAVAAPTSRRARDRFGDSLDRAANRRRRARRSVRAARSSGAKRLLVPWPRRSIISTEMRWPPGGRQARGSGASARRRAARPCHARRRPRPGAAWPADTSFDPAHGRHARESGPGRQRGRRSSRRHPVRSEAHGGCA